MGIFSTHSTAVWEKQNGKWVHLINNASALGSGPRAGPERPSLAKNPRWRQTWPRCRSKQDLSTGLDLFAVRGREWVSPAVLQGKERSQAPPRRAHLPSSLLPPSAIFPSSNKRRARASPAWLGTGGDTDARDTDTSCGHSWTSLTRGTQAPEGSCEDGSVMTLQATPG